MSMHEIEGLIEDSVHLIAKSKFPRSRKRDFLYNLYTFQARFDTGYTHFRLIDTLLKLKFTYRIPIEEHPDFEINQTFFKELDISETYWLPSEIGKENGFVYAKKEEEGIFLYADAGSEFWKRLCQENILSKSEHKAPKKFKVNYLFWKILWEAQLQDNIHLIRDWLALLIATIKYDLGPEDGFPNTFPEFARTKEASEIRLVAQHHNLFDEPYHNDDWGYLSRPALSDITNEETDIERLFMIRWLLDVATDKPKIRSEYKEAIKPDPDRTKKILLLPNKVEAHLGAHLKLVWEETHDYGQKWLFYQQFRGEEGKPSDSDRHMYLLFDMDIDDQKLISCKIGFQNGQLLRWQGRGLMHSPEHIHFYDNLFLQLNDGEFETNKNLHNMGGWKFNIKNTEKTLFKHLKDLFECFGKCSPKIIELYEKPLFHNFELTVAEALEERNKLKESHGYFLNDIEVYLVYAIHYFEIGKRTKSKELASKAKAMAEGKQHPIREEWIASAESILEGKPKLNELLSFERNYF